MIARKSTINDAPELRPKPIEKSEPKGERNMSKAPFIYEKIMYKRVKMARKNTTQVYASLENPTSLMDIGHTILFSGKTSSRSQFNIALLLLPFNIFEFYRSIDIKKYNTVLINELTQFFLLMMLGSYDLTFIVYHLFYNSCAIRY